jgi:hypothetical protein
MKATANISEQTLLQRENDETKNVARNIQHNGTMLWSEAWMS